MKTMKYIATALMLFSMTSCELERLDYTEISPENFFKTETDLKLAVNSLYYDFNRGILNLFILQIIPVIRLLEI